MEEDISNAMEQLLDLTISLQTRINQAYSELIILRLLIRQNGI